ncbi:MAG: hypothetical protein E7138_08365 [Rikenellaceae bacterium]|nr:hypothetical protein [Rikenellaceae bacterium]
MKRFYIILTILLASQLCCYAQKRGKGEIIQRDLYSDTWVATDAIGRTMPTNAETGDVKNDKRRVVGIFYITWHTQDLHNQLSPYTGDITQILERTPEARKDTNHPAWKHNVWFHYAEPEMGYFLSQDEWVIRKDLSMLADAGVDVMILDVTNAVRYWDEWKVIFETMHKMKAEGNIMPKFCFWAFNGPVITVVQELFNRVYKENKYSDLWFYWDEKPLLLYNDNPHHNASGGWTENPNPNYYEAAATDPNDPNYNNPDYTQKSLKDYTNEVKEFFTLRNMWWGYYEWGGKRFIGTEGNWSFGYNLEDERIKRMSPEELIAKHNGKPEQAAVTPAQHPVTMTENPMGIGKSWTRRFGEPQLNEYDMPEVGYIPYLKQTKQNPVLYGAYFQESWDYALKGDPEFLYINDWNEWTAMKFNTEGNVSWLGRINPFMFVDQYNMEFNRGIQPMKGGYSDNYYMQMAQNIRRYKGSRPIPEHTGYTECKIDGRFGDWKNNSIEYRDTQGDIFHRDAKGYAGLHYTNTSGRNDIITSKVAVGAENISFYAETATKLTPHTDKNWMMLLIDADNNHSTGWYGYDFIINKEVKDERTTTLMQYDSQKGEWSYVADIAMRYADNHLELTIPRQLLNLADTKFTLDFKWTDNPTELKDPISLCTDGDTAPNRRFNYRLIWNKE